MIKVFKSENSNMLYIETVTEGHIEDFRCIRNGDLFTIDRINTSIIEVSNYHYSNFRDYDNNVFSSANDFEDYMTSLLQITLNTINEDMSVISISTENEITTIDARQSTTNGNVTGAVSGKHGYIFQGQFNKPKLAGATTPITLNAGTNVTITGDEVIKNITGNSWNSSFYSTETFDPLVENFAISWLVESVDGTIREMGGLDDNATANNSYNSIEYAIYQVNNYFYSRVYEKGASIIIPNYTTFYLQIGDRLGIKVIDQIVTYFVLRGSTVYDIYTSNSKATTPLQFKGAFNRGNTSSGASRMGGVAIHTETEIDNFKVNIVGSASDVVSDEDKELLSKEAGIELLTSATYSKLELTRKDTDVFKNGGVPYEIEVTHEYRSLANQTINTF